MANPRWFMNAGEEGFSILGKAFDKADPAIDAILRVVARRAKSQPGSKFYDPQQEIMEKMPATSWKQALDRLNEIKLTSDKEADVVTPWKWEGPRPGEIAGMRTSFDSNVKKAVQQFDAAGKKTRDRAPKPFGVAWKDYWTALAKYGDNSSSNKAKARKGAAFRSLVLFDELQKADVPREWTGEAATTLLRKLLQSARINAENAKLANKAADLDYEMGRYLVFDGKSFLNYHTRKMIETIQKADVPNMTNKQRTLFFSMWGDLIDDTDPEEIGFIVRALAE
jgi:hypothetical protein